MHTADEYHVSSRSIPVVPRHSGDEMRWLIQVSPSWIPKKQHFAADLRHLSKGWQPARCQQAASACQWDWEDVVSTAEAADKLLSVDESLSN